MDSRRHSDVVRERVVRHNRLMRLIKNYSHSQEESRKLERIKINTMMEINIRYLRSEHNRYYKFPKADSTDSEDGHQQGRKEDTIYDLHSQNEVIRGRSVSSKVLSLDNSRKLVSLDVERNQWQKERLVRLNAKSKEHLSLKRSRKNSVGDKIRREESSKLFRLPELKRENLKTESKYGDSQELQSVIGHKMATQSSEKNLKMRGVSKYLKQVELKHKENNDRNNQTRSKKIFLPEMLT